MRRALNRRSAVPAFTVLVFANQGTPHDAYDLLAVLVPARCPVTLRSVGVPLPGCGARSTNTLQSLSSFGSSRWFCVNTGHYLLATLPGGPGIRRARPSSWIWLPGKNVPHRRQRSGTAPAGPTSARERRFQHRLIEPPKIAHHRRHRLLRASQGGRRKCGGGWLCFHWLSSDF